MDRRRFLQIASSLPLTSAAAPGAARAQGTWPSRNITMVVGVAAGGQADIAARPVALALEPILGRSVIVDNRVGAGGAIGAASVLRGEPDGYTMLMALS